MNTVCSRLARLNPMHHKQQKHTISYNRTLSLPTTEFPWHWRRASLVDQICGQHHAKSQHDESFRTALRFKPSEGLYFVMLCGCTICKYTAIVSFSWPCSLFQLWGTKTRWLKTTPATWLPRLRETHDGAVNWTGLMTTLLDTAKLLSKIQAWS